MKNQKKKYDNSCISWNAIKNYCKHLVKSKRIEYYESKHLFHTNTLSKLLSLKIYQIKYILYFHFKMVSNIDNIY